MTAPTTPESPDSDQADATENEWARLDPERSACVLIGVDGYEHLRSLPSVQQNLKDLEHALGDPDIWGVPKERRWVVRNPVRPSDLTDPIYEAMDVAEDTLLIYYAGHGLLEFHDDQLYLTLPSSRHGRFETSIPFNAIREIVRGAKESVKRRIVILDCCYSGKALDGAMAAGRTVPAERQIAIEGSYVLTSTTDSEEAEALPKAKHTAFTGAFINVLTQGDPENKQHELLTLNQIHDVLKTSLARQRLPEPQRLDENGVGDLLFVRNRQGPRLSPHSPAAPSRRTVVATAALALALGLVLGIPSGYLARAWVDPRTAPIPGPCDERGRAQLLSISDQLDQPPGNEYQGNPVEGLSALALIGDGSRALALRDNEPAQFYTFTLGAPERLEPHVTDMRMLYGENGERFEEFDGEGLVVEDGGDTILVAAESGPSIRRFGIADGGQIGDPFPVPEAFRPVPNGDAPRDRNLESLTVTPDGDYLYTGLEGPLLVDDDVHGRHQVRIQRYRGESGGDYVLDHQYGYRTEVGLYLVELLAIDENRLLALERGYLTGLGSAIRVYEVDVSAAQDVTGERLDKDTGDLLVRKELLFDMSECPEGDVVSEQNQPNQILDNVEGMALGPELEGTEYAGRHVLYMVSDNNGRDIQTTRLYSLAVDLG